MLGAYSSKHVDIFYNTAMEHSKAQKRELASVKSTTDLFFVDFLTKICDKPIFDYKHVGMHKVMFEFDMPDAEWRQLRIQFKDSDHQKLSLRIKDLASFAHRGKDYET